MYYAECHYAECHYAECCYAECRYAECHNAECRNAECHYAECHGTVHLSIFLCGGFDDAEWIEIVGLRDNLLSSCCCCCISDGQPFHFSIGLAFIFIVACLHFCKATSFFQKSLSVISAILIYDNDLRLIINIHLYEIFTTPLLIYALVLLF